MSGLMIAWLLTMPPILLVGWAFGFSSGRERERRKWLGRRRSCRNCSGFGHIRIGPPLFGPTLSCPDCHGHGYVRETPSRLPFPEYR